MSKKASIVNTPLYYILIILSCTLWGSAFAGAKIGFQYCPPILLSGLRFTLAGLILVPILLAKKQPFLSFFKHWKYMLMFGFIQTFVQYGSFYVGLDKVPAAVAAILVGSGPIFITILAHFTMNDDKFTRKKTLSIILGFSGIIFITLAKGGDNHVEDSFYYGIALLLISNLIGSTTNIIVNKKKHLGVSPVALTAFANFSGGLMLLVTALIFEPAMVQNPPLEFYLALSWLAIIPAAAFSAWYYLIEQDGVKVSELNIWKFIIPVTGVILSWLLISNEEPKWQEIVGVLIISLSIIVLQYPLKKRYSRKSN